MGAKQMSHDLRASMLSQTGFNEREQGSVVVVLAVFLAFALCGLAFLFLFFTPSNVSTTPNPYSNNNSGNSTAEMADLTSDADSNEPSINAKQDIETNELSDTEAESKKVFVYSGIISNSKTKDPIFGAQVRWVKPSANSIIQKIYDSNLILTDQSTAPENFQKLLLASTTTFTAPDGSFMLEIEGAGAQGILVVSKNAFSTESYDISAKAMVVERGHRMNSGILNNSFSDVTVVESSSERIARTQKESEETSRVVNIELHPGARLSGQVVTAAGAPAAGMVIEAFNANVIDSQGGFTFGSGAHGRKVVSDENGNFSFSGLALEQYKLAAHTGESPYVTKPASESESYLIRTGEDVNDAQIIVELGGTIAGSITNDKSKACRSCSIQVWPAQAQQDLMSGRYASYARFMNQTWTTDREGKFVIQGLPLGQEYTLKIQHPNYAPKSAEGIELTEEQPRVDLEIGLTLGATVRGQIVDKDGNLLPKHSIWITPLGKDSMQFLGGSRNYAKSDENGNFEFKHLAAGSHQISAGRSYGLRQRSGTIIELAEDEKLEGLQVTAEAPEVVEVAQATEKISGRVVDDIGDPIARASVSGTMGADHRWAQTDEDGFYEMAVLEGEYNIQATQSARSSDAVKAQSGSSADLMIKRGASVAGTVSLPDGSYPEHSFNISGNSVGPRNRMMARFGGNQQSVKSGDGTYSLNDLVPGKIEIVVNVPGFATARKTLELSPGEEITGFDIRVSNGGSLSGSVIAESGALAGASVHAIRVTGDQDELMMKMNPMMGGASKHKTKTDEKGYYSLAEMEPGNYLILVSHPDYASSSDERAIIADGRETKHTRIVLAAGAKMEFTILREGKPVTGAMVQVIGGSSAVKIMQSNAEGLVVVRDLTNGDYSYFIMEPERGYQQPSKVGKFSVDGARLYEEEIRLGEGTNISGEITGIPAPTSGQYMVALRKEETKKIEDREFKGMKEFIDFVGSLPSFGVVDKDLKYSLEDVEPGEYYLEVYPDIGNNIFGENSEPIKVYYRKKIIVTQNDLKHDIRAKIPK